MGDNGINEWDDGTAMSAKNVGDASRNESLTEEFGSGEGTVVLSDEDVVVVIIEDGVFVAVGHCANTSECVVFASTLNEIATTPAAPSW